MKKVFTLALSLFLCTSIFATAEFFVRINSNGNYTVSLNNQVITSSTAIFRFFDLHPGNNTLHVYLNGFNGRTIFNKNILIQDGFRTVAELDPRFGLTIIEKLPFVQQSWYIDNLLPYQQPAPFPPYPHHPYPKQPKKKCHVCGNYACSNHSSNYPPSLPGYGYGYGNLMDDASVQSLLETMKKVAFEEKMLEVARTALKSRQVSTAQVQQLLSPFAFEQNKLDLAKYCYDRTIDKQNYYTLYDDFAFSSYRSELDKYINSR